MLNYATKCPLWVKNVGLALGCKLPVYPSEPTCSGTALTAAKGRYCCKSLYGVANENSESRRCALRADHTDSSKLDHGPS
jgi:hypothetical protein